MPDSINDVRFILDDRSAWVPLPRLDWFDAFNSMDAFSRADAFNGLDASEAVDRFAGGDPITEVDAFNLPGAASADVFVGDEERAEALDGDEILEGRDVVFEGDERLAWIADLTRSAPSFLIGPILTSISMVSGSGGVIVSESFPASSDFNLVFDPDP